MNGAELLNGRGLLETIRLADRALELEKELELMRNAEGFRTWAIEVVQKSDDFRRVLAKKMASDEILKRNFPEPEARKHCIQQMAAQFAALIIQDACRGATIETVENVLSDGITTRLNTIGPGIRDRAKIHVKAATYHISQNRPYY